MSKLSNFDIKNLSEKTVCQLFYGARNGSMRAYNRLFEATEPRIKAIARYLKNNYASEEDLYIKGCESFVEIVNSKRHIHKPKNYFLRYLKKDIWGECLRQRKRNLQFVFEDKFLEFQKLKQKKSISLQTNPYRVITIDEVLREVKKLPANYQKIFEARIFTRETSRELSKKLGLSVGNIDKIWERIKKQLQQWGKV